jgi:GxxExxY protein
MQKILKLPADEITSVIIKCCYDVMNELGTGFLESIYKNALLVALLQENIEVQVERSFHVHFRGKKVGSYRADIVVADSVITELKCCKILLPEHQAQVINYLKATNLPAGILVNFGNKKLEIKRLHHPQIHAGVKIISSQLS